MIRFKESYSIFKTTLVLLKSRKKFNLTKDFFFQHVSETTVRTVVKNLPSDKVSAGEIIIKILKENKFCFPEITNYIKESLRNNKFQT